MIKITKKVHHGINQIFLEFDYDISIINSIKKIQGVLYSKTYKSWYLPYTKQAWQSFLQTGLNYQIVEIGTTGDTKPLSDNTDKQSSAVSYNCALKTADKNEISIRYHHPMFLITGKLSIQELKLLKSIPKIYWNERFQNWVIRANIQNLEFLKNEMKFITQQQFEIWTNQISLIENPPKCMLYQSPEFPEKILIQLTGEGIDVNFVKYIPERSYHSDKKFWVIPNDKKLIERIIEHYTALKTTVVNKINVSKTINKSTNYQELKKYLLNKTPNELNNISEIYLDTLIRERYSGNTLREYHSKFILFAKSIYPKKCDEITEAEVNEYITKISSDKISEALINAVINAIKFYYQKVIYLPEFKIERIKRPRKVMLLPKVLSVQEIDRMLRATHNLKHTTLLYAIYGHGLRLNEVLNLRLEDILWDRNQVFIKKGKGKKDRYINMSQEFKTMMSVYVHEYKPKHWLFEGQQPNSQYAERSVQEVVKQAAQKANINKRVTPHTLRHCFATHLLDSGTQLPYIKELLGHKDLKTTMIYTHITTSSIEKVVSPLDNLLNIRVEKIKNPQ